MRRYFAVCVPRRWWERAGQASWPPRAQHWFRLVAPARLALDMERSAARPRRADPAQVPAVAEPKAARRRGGRARHAARLARAPPLELVHLEMLRRSRCVMARSVRANAVSVMSVGVAGRCLQNPPLDDVPRAGPPPARPRTHTPVSPSFHLHDGGAVATVAMERKSGHLSLCLCHGYIVESGA